MRWSFQQHKMAITWGWSSVSPDAQISFTGLAQLDFAKCSMFQLGQNQFMEIKFYSPQINHSTHKICHMGLSENRSKIQWSTIISRFLDSHLAIPIDTQSPGHPNPHSTHRSNPRAVQAPAKATPLHWQTQGGHAAHILRKSLHGIDGWFMDDLPIDYRLWPRKKRILSRENDGCSISLLLCVGHGEKPQKSIELPEACPRQLWLQRAPRGESSRSPASNKCDLSTVAVYTKPWPRPLPRPDPTIPMVAVGTNSGPLLSMSASGPKYSWKPPV